MRIPKPWLLTNRSTLEDQITCLNLCYKGQTLYVCKKWYRNVVNSVYLDDLDFHLVVEDRKYYPQIPTLL